MDAVVTVDMGSRGAEGAEVPPKLSHNKTHESNL